LRDADLYLPDIHLSLRFALRVIDMTQEQER